ncbi:hypothetical protein SprV_0902756800 [Sparganum proliferum]
MVKLLLKAGADLHVSDCPRYPLHQACLYGRPAVSDLLIRSGAKTTVLTEHYQSCLHLLANQSAERFLETARVLLSHNCDPNTLDDDGLAPLHRASLEMVHVLASSDKTDLNILSQAGDTPLLTAAKDRREAVLLALIRVEQEHQQAALAASELSGARAPANRTPSSKSAGSATSRFTLLSNGSLSACAVTNRAATPNRQSSGWAQRVFRTASAATIQLQSATSAAFSGSTRPTLVPLDFRQPQQQHPLELETPLVADAVTPFPPPPPSTMPSDTKRRKDASLERLPPKSPALQKVVKPRLNLDQPDNIGMTPLMISAEAGQNGFRMVVGLVSAGCDISAVDKMGMTALHYACYVGAIATVRFLIEEAGEFSDKRPLDLLNFQDRFGRTPIYLATCRGHTEVVTYLLSCNADIHSPNKELKSPLYIAANFGHLDIVNALLRHGAQVDQADSHNKTPLYMATYHGRLDIVSLLLAANANVNAADKNGRTPLYIAVLHGHLSLAHKLLAAGASVNRPDNEGLGPLHMAVKFPKLDIPMIKLLLSHGCDPVNLACFTRWLLAHGIIPEECIQGDDELAEWLRQEESNVRSLKRLCRTEIQLALGNADSMQAKIGGLPLPEHLRSFVSMRAL